MSKANTGSVFSNEEIKELDDLFEEIDSDEENPAYEGSLTIGPSEFWQNLLQLPDGKSAAGNADSISKLLQ